jgi:hypothetical protein
METIARCILFFRGEAISKKFVATFTFFVYFICLIIVYPINSLYQKVGSSNETLEYDLKLANALNVSTSKLAYVSMGVVSNQRKYTRLLF